jgi:tRNA threonylcarbamoyladenosine biosynthesis protein TsaB
MLLLVIDTSGRDGYVALARAANCSDFVEVIESAPLAGGTFSAQLVPQICALLNTHKFGRSDIDGFVVVSGPGSFTGLRIGLAAIKGLAEILAKPIAAVSLLEVLAAEGAREGKVAATMDGGRGEVFAGSYEIDSGRMRILSEQLITREEFLESAHGSTVATADEALANALREAGMNVVVAEAPAAAAIARLGWRKLQAGETIAADVLDANYMRRWGVEKPLAAGS